MFCRDPGKTFIGRDDLAVTRYADAGGNPLHLSCIGFVLDSLIADVVARTIYSIRRGIDLRPLGGRIVMGQSKFA